MHCAFICKSPAPEIALESFVYPLLLEFACVPWQLSTQLCLRQTYSGLRRDGMRPSARFTCPYPIQIGAQSISTPMSRILELNLILMICLRNFAPLHVLLRLSSKIPMLALAQETLLSYPIASSGALSRFRIHYTNTRDQSPWRKQIFSRGLVLCRRLGWTLLIFGLSKELMASLERPRRRGHPFDSEPFFVDGDSDNERLEWRPNQQAQSAKTKAGATQDFGCISATHQLRDALFGWWCRRPQSCGRTFRYIQAAETWRMMQRAPRNINASPRSRTFYQRDLWLLESTLPEQLRIAMVELLH